MNKRITMMVVLGLCAVAQAGIVTTSSTNPFGAGDYAIDTLSENDSTSPMRRNDLWESGGGANNQSRILGQSFTAAGYWTMSNLVLRAGIANNFTSKGPTLSVKIFHVPAIDSLGSNGTLVAEDTFDLTGKNIAASDYLNLKFDTPISLTEGEVYLASIWFATDQAGLNNKFTLQRKQTAGGVPGPYADGRFYDSLNLDATTAIDGYNDGSLPPPQGIGIRDLAFGVVALAGYDGWANAFELSGGDAADDADPDGDKLLNLYEYGLGGNPTNPADVGMLPSFQVLSDGGSNWVEYIHVIRNAAAGELVYAVETRENLVIGDWLQSGYEVTGTNDLGNGFSEVTNEVPTDVPARFIHLQINRP